MATVGFVFAPLAPLVPVAAAIVFWVSSWVYKYQLMFVFVSRVESGGVSYPLNIHDVYHLPKPTILETASLERDHQPTPCWCHFDATAHGPE